jgi:hypothetical protein
MDLAQHHDGGQGPMQLPIPTPVAAIADDLARGRRDRGRPGQHGEGGLGTEPARMGPADQELGGGDGADPGLGHQHRGHGGDELAYVSFGKVCADGRPSSRAWDMTYRGTLLGAISSSAPRLATGAPRCRWRELGAGAPWPQTRLLWPSTPAGSSWPQAPTGGSMRPPPGTAAMAHTLHQLDLGCCQDEQVDDRGGAGLLLGMTARPRCTWRPTTNCRPGADDPTRPAAYRRSRPTGCPTVGRR